MSEKLSPDKAIELINKNTIERFTEMGKTSIYNAENKSNYFEIYTGIPTPVFNSILDAHLSSNNIQNTIDQIMTIFKENKMPAFWYVWPSSQPDDLSHHLLNYGFALANENPGMLADFSQLPQEMPIDENLQIKRVSSEEMLEDWKIALKEGYQMPDHLTNFYRDVFKELGWSEDSPNQHYVAYQDNQPVAGGTIFLGKNDVAGLWNIATIPEARGKGIGTAITWQACLDAHQRGYRYGVLLSTELGYGVYQRLGFEEYCKVGYYLWSPE